VGCSHAALVLKVDVDPPIRELSSEQFGPPQRLSAVGEDGGPPMLMFHGPLLARVFVGVDDVAVGEVLSGIIIISWFAHALRVRTSWRDSGSEFLRTRSL
jgi:hypothetical protein